MIPSLSGMISPNLIDKITTLLFDDINNADDGTLIVYFVAEAMREIYKPYSEKLDEDDIPNRNLYFDFCNNELVVRCVDEKAGSSSAEFVSGSVLISTPQTNVELLNNSFKLTAEQICNKYRDSKPESEWDESFKRIYASNFRRFLSGLGNEFYDLFEVNLNKTVLNYLSGLKILLEDYASKSINNGVEYRGTNLLDYYLNFIVDNKEIDNSLYRFFEKSCDNENYYVTLNPEVIGIDFVLKKIHSDSKVFEKFNTFYMKGYISFLLKNICSLEELITAVPISEGQQLLFALAHLDEIPVSLKLLSNLSSVTRTKNLLISDTFIPMNKKIVLYDLPGLYFDENLMIALSKIETYFNIDQSNSNICFDKNEEKSWNLLFDCIDSGHLDFNLYVEEAKSNLIYLKNEQTK